MDALTRHFKGRVKDWTMWNEPDNNSAHTPEKVAEFNVRTAKIVKRNIPEARVAGLIFNNADPEKFRRALTAMGPEGVKLFASFVYHSYEQNPESSYRTAEKAKAVVKQLAPHAQFKQGENGAPSEMVHTLALLGLPWSEYSQAKYDLRRMLGDLGRDIPCSVFTICDYYHVGRELATYGLLRANRSHEVTGVKRAFYAVQNLVTLFDSRTKRVTVRTVTSKDRTVALWEYVRDGMPVYVFWDQGNATDTRPGDSFTTRPLVQDGTGPRLKDPVWIDLLTGRVYEFPERDVRVHRDGVTYLNVPLYDSPAVLTERALVQHFGISTN